MTKLKPLLWKASVWNSHTLMRSEECNLLMKTHQVALVSPYTFESALYIQFNIQSSITEYVNLNQINECSYCFLYISQVIFSAIFRKILAISTIYIFSRVISVAEVIMCIRNASSHSMSSPLKNDICLRAPSKKKCITITTKFPSLRSCRVTVHTQINEPLNAVCNSNSWHLSDNAELPSPHRWENGQRLSWIFIDLKSAECPLKESKMCIRHRWQMLKVQSLKQFCRPTKTGVKGIISIPKFSTWSKGL